LPGSLVVVNPRASRARDASTLAALTERIGTRLRRRDGTPPRITETASPEAVPPLVAGALQEGVASVIGVGGDGTMRAIAGALAGTDVPLGIVPTGTGNQIASALGLPRAPLAAVDALERAEVRAVDIGEVTVRAGDTSQASAFLIGCGAGFDAQLVAATSGRLKRRLGSLAYFLQGARLALRLTATRCRVTVDDEAFETRATTVLIGNMGQLVPGRLDLRLPLDPFDGLLDLIVVSATDPVTGLRGLVDQLRRTKLGGGAGDVSIRRRGRRLAVEPAETMPLEIDGDTVGRGSLAATVRPAALRVLLPGNPGRVRPPGS
jgi:YegS/Rv2252/BmrU family lipid kinase